MDLLTKLIRDHSASSVFRFLTGTECPHGYGYVSVQVCCVSYIRVDQRDSGNIGILQQLRGRFFKEFYTMYASKVISMSPPGSSEVFKGQDPITPILVSLGPDTVPEPWIELSKCLLNSTMLKFLTSFKYIWSFFKEENSTLCFLLQNATHNSFLNRYNLFIPFYITSVVAMIAYIFKCYSIFSCRDC